MVLKRRLLLLVAMGIFVILAGCTAEQPTPDQELARWLSEAKLDAQETPEELYRAALEEDTLVVYTTTTRMYDVKESFESAYPGLSVEVYDARAHDMVESLLNAFEHRDWQWDVIICADDDGRLTEQLLPTHMLNTYLPQDIAPALAEGAADGLLYFVGECEQLFYNSDVYDASPVSNWWQLTEPQWRGRVYMNSPLRSMPAYGLLHSVIANSDKMAAAYEAHYGKPLSVPEGSSAGQIFWERLVANGLQFTTSSNELVEIVGAPGQTEPPVAFMISSKLRRTEIGLQVAPAYGVIPCDGVYAPNSVSIAGGAKNISAAKLFVRWLLGETDGTGEGLQPYQKDGTWPVRTDVPCLSPLTLDEGNFWFNDKSEVITQRETILAFWSRLQGAGSTGS